MNSRFKAAAAVVQIRRVRLHLKSALRPVRSEGVFCVACCATLLLVRAIVLTAFTGLDGLELAEVPDRSPGDGEALVNVRAASLGPWDVAGAHGAFASAGGSSDFAQVQGWDFAGETVDGRRVVGFVAQPWMGVGAFAEQISIPSALLADLSRGHHCSTAGRVVDDPQDQS
jgi:hypothetical protein